MPVPFHNCVPIPGENADAVASKPGSIDLSFAFNQQKTSGNAGIQLSIELAKCKTGNTVALQMMSAILRRILTDGCICSGTLFKPSLAGLKNFDTGSKRLATGEIVPLAKPTNLLPDDSWRQQTVKFKSAGTYASGAAEISFWLGYGVQTLQIGGVELLNYGGVTPP